SGKASQSEPETGEIAVGAEAAGQATGRLGSRGSHPRLGDVDAATSAERPRELADVTQAGRLTGQMPSRPFHVLGHAKGAAKVTAGAGGEDTEDRQVTSAGFDQGIDGQVDRAVAADHGKMIGGAETGHESGHGGGLG